MKVKAMRKKEKTDEIMRKTIERKTLTSRVINKTLIPGHTGYRCLAH